MNMLVTSCGGNCGDRVRSPTKRICVQWNI